jgi:hypothetical protein
MSLNRMLQNFGVSEEDLAVFIVGLLAERQGVSIRPAICCSLGDSQRITWREI